LELRQNDKFEASLGYIETLLQERKTMQISKKMQKKAKSLLIHNIKTPKNTYCFKGTFFYDRKS
jgi:hypothetical protein